MWERMSRTLGPTRYRSMTAWEALRELMENPPTKYASDAGFQHRACIKVMDQIVRQRSIHFRMKLVLEADDGDLLNNLNVSASDLMAFRLEFGYWEDDHE